jgi:FkbM family methyltransferase
MNIFLDLGAFKGSTVDAFFDKQFVENPQTYTLYCFEPQDFTKEFEQLNKDYGNVNYIKKAAWLYDGEVEFSFIPDSTVSSTIFKNNHYWEKGVKSKVECLDFCKWLEQFKNDYIILKLNIEGAEFDLLDKMIETGAIRKMNKLFVEWHDAKVIPPMTDRRKEIEKYCEGIGLLCKSWRRSNVKRTNLWKQKHRLI